MPLAPTNTAAAAMAHPQLPAAEQAQAAGTDAEETDSAVSAGAKAVAPEAEAVVLEAVSAAAAMVEAFPHLLDDLGEALVSKLRCAMGELCHPSPPPQPPHPEPPHPNPRPPLPPSTFL